MTGIMTSTPCSIICVKAEQEANEEVTIAGEMVVSSRSLLALTRRSMQGDEDSDTRRTRGDQKAEALYGSLSRSFMWKRKSRVRC